MNMRTERDEAREAEVGAEALEARIEAMFVKDRRSAWAFVVGLWLVVCFVLLAMHPLIQNKTIEIVCWVAAFVLLLFNTTSIWAMVRHYNSDMNHIYSVDIRHLDAGR
jgi:hypothetical protein